MEFKPVIISKRELICKRIIGIILGVLTCGFIYKHDYITWFHPSSLKNFKKFDEWLSKNHLSSLIDNPLAYIFIVSDDVDLYVWKNRDNDSWSLFYEDEFLISEFMICKRYKKLTKRILDRIHEEIIMDSI